MLGPSKLMVHFLLRRSETSNDDHFGFLATDVDRDLFEARKEDNPYRVEAAKTTAAPLAAKFGVKAGGDYNANRTVPLVFWGLLVPACQMVQFINFAHLVS